MVLCPVVKATLKEVTELENTERGSGGFGSTGIQQLMALNLKEYQRFEKQIILKKVGISGQKKINKAKVYWENTEVFWKKVRDAWSQKLENSKNIKVIKEIDNEMLFAKLFSLANDFSNGDNEAINKVEAIIEEYTR